MSQLPQSFISWPGLLAWARQHFLHFDSHLFVGRYWSDSWHVRVCQTAQWNLRCLRRSFYFGRHILIAEYILLLYESEHYRRPNVKRLGYKLGALVNSITKAEF